jgi:hypothetical protein
MWDWTHRHTVLNSEEQYAEELGPSIPPGPRKLCSEMIKKGRPGPWMEVRQGILGYSKYGELVLPESLKKVNK